VVNVGDVKKHGDKYEWYWSNNSIGSYLAQYYPQSYKNKTQKGGRPEIDVIVMFKALIIQKMHVFTLIPELR
jgi:hypothetical protein